MCGIAGYLSDRPTDEAILERMVGALVHRGPDAEGIYCSGPYRAGMRRLSINDLATGDPPLFNCDRSVVLLYNGEIYNSPALRRELEGQGCVFRTRSDGEVICHLYERHGEDLFERLDGMFAAALWIEPARKLILARDIPGEKPLHYAELPEGGIAFASEIRSLLHHPGVPRGLNLQALWDFPTFLWIPEPDTAYAAVRALPPGHLLIADGRGARIRPYRNRWNAEPIPGDDAAAIRETRRVVEEAVESRLLSDVPVGAFLSGGLDSSIVAALAARRLDRLTTFTIGFEDLSDPYHGRADEAPAAEAFARALGTDHRTIRVTEQTFRDSLDAFCRHGDQPFAVSSGLGILAVARAAREAGIKVLLSGDGADECFGGYSWYEHLEDAGGSSEAQEVSFQNFGMPIGWRLGILRGYTPRNLAWAWHYYASEGEKRRLFAGEPFHGVRSSLRWFGDAPRWTADEFIAQDRRFYFPNEMLRKVDRMTMAHSVEGRVPYAAPAVLAHAGKLRFGHRVREGRLKWVLRRAFEDLLPRGIVDRPKHGFNVPIDHWLQGGWSDLVRETFASGSALSKAGLIHPGSAAAAREMLADPVRLNGHTIFCYVILNRWLETV